jgi:hypothetical protein
MSAHMLKGFEELVKYYSTSRGGIRWRNSRSALALLTTCTLMPGPSDLRPVLLAGSRFDINK